MGPIISSRDFLHPQLSIETQSFIRMAYGVLLIGSLLWALPQWHRFFVSERWGGYASSARNVDIIQNPFVSYLIAVLWLVCATFITLGWWTVYAALLNLILCRYFFVTMRWKGVLRGMGAPGFMTYWLAAVIFLLDLTLNHGPQLRSLALLVVQVDFAFIMLSAGLYKLTAGYAQNQGMELGMVNPEWGYWWWLYKRVPPDNRLFKTLNHLAWATEVVGAILMIIPQTRFLGASLILFSFIFIATQIRLGLLCEMVIVGCFLFFHAGSLGDQFTTWLLPRASTVHAQVAVSSSGNALMAVALWTFLFLLPLAHGGLFFNFYARRSLPRFLQRALEAYTNFFGIIIWRVFSVDVVNFFVLIYRKELAGGERTLLSRYGLRGGLRYDHVGECITVTSLFTTLKYYPSNDGLFQERLLRYARTVPHASDQLLDFDYVSIEKRERAFEFRTVAVYTVDTAAGTVSDRVFDETFSVYAAHVTSPVHEGVRPGTYVPLRG